MAVMGGEEVKEEVIKSQTKLEEEDEVEARVELRPWEQHSSVIIIPRYDYNAPSSLLQHSHSGFLITCPIRREKSATKEAISILEKFIGCNSFLEETDRDDVTKRRKLCPVDEESEETIRYDLSKEVDLPSKKNEELDGQKHTLSLVKVTGSGLLLFISQKDSSLDTVNVVANVLQSIDTGVLKRPLWCHRIMPIQATCKLGEKELSSVVSTLVRAFVSNQAIKPSTPVKFAVGYNRRGADQTEMKSVKSSSSDLNPSAAILDRDKCFAIVAATVKGIVPDAVVDLKSPEICILIECIPLSRVSSNSLVAAVSVLPHSLVCSKRKLSVKALTLDSKASKGGQSKE